MMTFLVCLSCYLIKKESVNNPTQHNADYNFTYDLKSLITDG